MIDASTKAPATRPLFILGSGRCGSTLLRAILIAHSKIAITDEARVVNVLHFCSQLAATPAFEPRELILAETHKIRGIIGRKYCSLFSALFDRQMVSLLEEFYRQAFPDKQFLYWGDKLPDPASAHAVACVYPESRAITLVRDPRDVVSSFRNLSANDPSMDDPFFPVDDLPMYCETWTKLYLGCIRHFPRNLVVRYEDLIDHAERELGRMMAHLGLDPEPGQRNQTQLDSVRHGHATSSTVSASVARWRKDLSAADVKIVETICEPIMRECGYAASAD